MNNLANNHYLATGGDTSLLINSFIKTLDINPASRATYSRVLKLFFEFLAKREDRTCPTKQTLIEYKQELITNKSSPYTINNNLTVIKQFFLYAHDMGLMDTAIKGVKAVKAPKGFRKDALTVEQAKRILSTLPLTTPTDKRNYALFSLLLNCGLRLIEVKRANVGDIRHQAGQAVMDIQGKGRAIKDEYIIITDKVLTAINAYLTTRSNINDDSPLFSSVSDRNNGQRLTTMSLSRIIKKIFRDNNLNSHRLTAHSLRHTAITFALLGGATMQEAKALGRHADINTTLIYAHNIDRINNAGEQRIASLLNN